jgi:hypothetical protein
MLSRNTEAAGRAGAAVIKLRPAVALGAALLIIGLVTGALVAPSRVEVVPSPVPGSPDPGARPQLARRLRHPPPRRGPSPGARPQLARRLRHPPPRGGPSPGARPQLARRLRHPPPRGGAVMVDLEPTKPGEALPPK